MPPSINAQVAPATAADQPGPWALPPEPKTGSAEEQLQQALVTAMNDPAGADPTSISHLATALNQLRLSRGVTTPDKWTVVNIGGGKIALVDAKNGDFKVQDVSGNNGRPATVSPGEGVYNPATGIYDTPVQAAPTRTAAQIAAESGANVTQSNAAAGASDAAAARSRAETANMQTPAQRQQFELAQIHARAKAEGDARLAEWNAKVQAGYLMKPADEAKLTADLKEIAAQHDTERAQAFETFKHELAAPDVEAARKLTERQVVTGEANATTNAAQAEASRVYQQQQVELSRRGEEQSALKAQGEQGQANLASVVKSGTQLSAGTFNAAVAPIQYALHLARQAVQIGSLPPSAVPTPQLPSTAVQPTSRALPTPVSAPETPRPGAYWH